MITFIATQVRNDSLHDLIKRRRVDCLLLRSRFVGNTRRAERRSFPRSIVCFASCRKMIRQDGEMPLKMYDLELQRLRPCSGGDAAVICTLLSVDFQMMFPLPYQPKISPPCLSSSSKLRGRSQHTSRTPFSDGHFPLQARGYVPFSNFSDLSDKITSSISDVFAGKADKRRRTWQPYSGLSQPGYQVRYEQGKETRIKYAFIIVMHIRTLH